jgi:hypothetical protein
LNQQHDFAQAENVAGMFTNKGNMNRDALQENTRESSLAERSNRARPALT